MELRDAGVVAGVENFTVLQEGFVGAEANLAFDNQRDISIDGFSVSVSGTTLLENTSLKVRHGDRYGLLGANGAGKSTLLLLIAKRKVRLPACIDLLMVEQECVADDTPAITAVLRMDAKRESLIAEEKAILARLDGTDQVSSFMYRYILRESCSQFDSLPLTSLTILHSTRMGRTTPPRRRRATRMRETRRLPPTLCSTA